jgi:glyoxylase-like metal-dependent hydrolase (beta-lactamase superfamily II)
VSLAACSSVASADIIGTPQRPPQFDPEIRTVKLTDQLYLLQGAGGNVAVFVWNEGVLLVDDKIAAVSARVKAAIASITPKPIRFVVNTHWHPDHRGGNAALAGDGAVIVAHENVRRRMSVDGFIAVFGRKQPASPLQALPIVTFTSDVTFHLGDEEISIVHVDPAHTDGDSFVRFRRANALHMGDCFLNGSYPVIDYTNGGSYGGTIAAADAALRMADRGTRIIPGHGAVSNVRELREWRDMLAMILERVRKSGASGKSLEQVKRERPTREWDGGLPDSFVTSDHVVEEAYRDATAGPAR